MEAEPLSFPDNSSIDSPQPPPGSNFPKPDFTEVQKHPDTPPTEKPEAPLFKPTFKNILQAKKRLQAFSSTRPGSLPSSPKKPKLNAPVEEKNDEAAKKLPKKGATHVDKARAVIEEIEEIKRGELVILEQKKQACKRSRSRSRTPPDKGRFKKVDKKSRNYRRKSISPKKVKESPKKPKESPKKQKRYPRNWREFCECDADFDTIRTLEVAPPTGNNELLRQCAFESPSLPIVLFKMKTVNGKEKVVPFEHVRYTHTKPVIPFSVNFSAITETFMSRKMLLQALPKDIVANIEAVYSNSIKFDDEERDPKVKKSRSWYQKIWKDVEKENTKMKIFEKSVGLSFLQTYTGEEEEEDDLIEIVEEEQKIKEDRSRAKKQNLFENVKTKEEKLVEDVKAKEEKLVEDVKAKEEKLVEDVKAKEEKLVEDVKAKEEVIPKEKAGEEIVKKKKKKKKEKKNEGDVADKKKKRKSREKKKPLEENSEEKPPKKKKKRDSKGKIRKKEKRAKDTKHKRKKTKEKKKKPKDKPQPEQKPPVERLTKEQVIEELKEIEEKLAKKRQEDKQKNDKEEEKTRKRKHSERDEEPKKPKHEKHRRVSEEPAVDHALKRKLEKTKKHEKEKEEKKNEDKRNEEKRKEEKRKEEPVVRKRKSRWSEAQPTIKEEFPDFDELKIIEEIARSPDEKEFEDNTPDTDEYHSHWESDDDVSSSVAPRNSLKLNRSWESDEELFERSHNRDAKPSESYANLEIPLEINFPRRSTNSWQAEKPRSVVEELKLLEEERRSLSEERKKLELEKRKILKLQEDAKVEQKTEEATERPPSPEEVKVKKEKCEINDFSIDSLNSSLLSTVSSTESNFPIGVLENEYEEFIKAVSSESSKKKPEQSVSDSSTSSSWSSDSEKKKKRRRSKQKKRRKHKTWEREGLLLGKGNNIFNEFDIPVPSEIPEMVPTPVPVPSPIIPFNNILTLNAAALLPPEQPQEQLPEDGLDLTKPFVFSSIVLPKKTPLVDNLKLKLDDDSDSTDFTEKFAKKPDVKEEPDKKNTVIIEEEEEKIPEATKVEEIVKVTVDEIKNVAEIETVETVAEIQVGCEVIAERPPAIGQGVQDVMPEPIPVIDISSVPLPPERDTPAAQMAPIKRSSRSVSPRNRSIERTVRRSRSRSPPHPPRRRSPIRRRDPTPPSRRRHPSPRRRSPPRRRGSPHRRSPSPKRRSLSPRRRSPPRRRRRSPSLSPPRSRGPPRKRTPSPPRRRASPLNSPLDGFKRSVADSTISDDMLPQPTPDDYGDSPNPYVGGVKFFKVNKGLMSASPVMSPRRVSLDERISQVLGLEKEAGAAAAAPPAASPVPPPKPKETFPTYNHSYNSSFGPQYNQYGQYMQAPYGNIMYTQPPPPIAKPPPTPTKVLQVGNILQVVPTEELPPPVIESKTPERPQKIVQVGNMLQIVPAVMPPPKQAAIVEPPSLPPQPVAKPVVHVVEKQSAETLMKQKTAERKAEREKRRLDRERRRKEKEKKRKDKEKKKQMKLKLKTENMIKRAIQIETEALANDELEEEPDNADAPVQWPPVPVVISATPTGKGILAQGGSKQRKSVQFADGVRPGEGTSPSGGEELSSPPPRKLPKEKRYKKIKIPKKSKKKKVRVKVVKKPVVLLEEDDDDDDDNLPPPSPPPGSPPPHVFPSRVKTHTINNVHQYVGNILQSGGPGYAFRSPMPPPVVMNRHQPPPGYLQGAYPQEVNNLPHPSYQGVPSHH